MDLAKKIKNQRTLCFWILVSKKNFFGDSSAYPKSLLKNKRGFVTITLLALFPLLICSTLCCLTLGWFLGEKEKMQMICEDHTLAAQTALIDGANRLVQLNPQVDALVIDKQSLELALSLAVTPAEKFAIATQLTIVRFKIIALRTQQKLIIKTTETRALLQLQQINIKTRREAIWIPKLWQSSRRLISATRFKKPRLQVDAHYADRMIPTYHIPQNYSSRQTIYVQIEIRGPTPFPKWIPELSKQQFYWQENCSSHPRQGGLKWQSYLGKGKHFGSFSSFLPAF